MNHDDQKQLGELDSQRREVLAQRDRLQEELREVPAKLHLIDVRRKLVEESAMPQAVLGAEPGPAEREHLGLRTMQTNLGEQHPHVPTPPAAEPTPDNQPSRAT